jgi:hypothetical protein
VARWWCGERSGDLGGACFARFGGAAEGDFEAEGAGLADVVGELPADAGPAVVGLRQYPRLLALIRAVARHPAMTSCALLSMTSSATSDSAAMSTAAKSERSASDK